MMAKEVFFDSSSSSKGCPDQSMFISHLFGIYGQPGVPMDFWLLTFFHAVVAIPVHIIILRARSRDGYTSLFSKEGYPSDN